MPAVGYTALGIDVGGTKTMLGVVRFPGPDVLIEKTIPTLPTRDSKLVLEDIARLADELSAKAAVAGLGLSGVGIGICELINPQGEILSHNCLAWTKGQLEGQLRHLGPVILEADVRAAARAEALYGAGRPFRSFLYVTVGTGIACCLVIDGCPYLGSHGATGTMGSGIIGFACEQCQHLNAASLEQIASGPALAHRWNQVQTEKVGSAQEVFALAVAGNRDAQHIIQSAGEALGSTVALLVNVFDPPAIIVGGGLGLSEGLYWTAFINSSRKGIWSEVNRELPIVQAGLGIRGGMIGAALIASQRNPVRYRERRVGGPGLQ